MVTVREYQIQQANAALDAAKTLAQRVQALRTLMAAMESVGLGCELGGYLLYIAHDGDRRHAVVHGGYKLPPPPAELLAEVAAALSVEGEWQPAGDNTVRLSWTERCPA